MTFVGFLNFFWGSGLSYEFDFFSMIGKKKKKLESNCGISTIKKEMKNRSKTTGGFWDRGEGRLNHTISNRDHFHSKVKNNY